MPPWQTETSWDCYGRDLCAKLINFEDTLSRHCNIWIKYCTIWHICQDCAQIGSRVENQPLGMLPATPHVGRGGAGRDGREHTGTDWQVCDSRRWVFEAGETWHASIYIVRDHTRDWEVQKHQWCKFHPMCTSVSFDVTVPARVWIYPIYLSTCTSTLFNRDVPHNPLLQVSAHRAIWLKPRHVDLLIYNTSRLIKQCTYTSRLIQATTCRSAYI